MGVAKLFHGLDGGSLGDGDLELFVLELGVCGNAFHGHDELILVLWPAEGDGGGVLDTVEVEVAAVDDLGFEGSLVVVEVLLVGEEVFAMESNDAHGSELLGAGLAAHDVEDVFGAIDEVLLLGVFFGNGFGGDGIQLIVGEAADDHGIEEEAGAKVFVPDGAFALAGVESGVCHVLGGDHEDEAVSVAAEVKEDSLYEGSKAADAEHSGFSEEEHAAEGGVVGGLALLLLEVAGLNIDFGGHALKLGPLVVEAGDEFVSGHGLDDRRGDGHGELALGGEHGEAAGEGGQGGGEEGKGGGAEEA